MASSSKPATNLAEHSDTIVDLDERSWLPRYAGGDSAAFSELLAAYQRPVYSYLVRCGVAASWRDDLFQEIFLKIHAAAGSYRSTQALRPWLFTIAANTVRNHFRSRRSTPPTDFGRDDPSDNGQPTLDSLVETQQTLSWLEQAIAMLPLKQRQVLLLTTVEGLRQQEVAEILDLPLNSVKTCLRRARLTLIEGISQREQHLPGDRDD